jgi:outer membrane protein TolC
MVKTQFMRKIILLFLLALIFRPATPRAQESFLLDSALAEAGRHYPAVRDKEWIRQQEQLALAQLKTQWLPQVQLNGQASYQSDVTRLPVSLPGVTIDPLSKDQYRAVADISQLIYDGGVMKSQRALQQQESQTDQSKVEVELQQLKERLSQYFLGVVLMDAQRKQAGLVMKDIETGMQKIQIQIQEGVAFRSNYDVLKAEWLKADQRLLDIQSSREALIDLISLYIGRKLDSSVHFTAIAPGDFIANEIKRPELRLFEQQRLLTGTREQLIKARTRPKLQLYAQGGYGRPGLNMLNNEFDLFYIGGVRFNWQISSLYTLKKERQQQATVRRRIDVQEDLFRQQTDARLIQEAAAIKKLEQLMERDREIIRLRESITKAASAQLENSVITANDYLREINAEDQARQALLLHEAQWLQARINYQIISGN